MSLNRKIRKILKEEVSYEIQKKLANTLLKRSYNLRHKHLTNLRNDNGKLANNVLGDSYEKFLDILYGYFKNDKMDDLSNALRGVLSTDKKYVGETEEYKYYNMLLSEMGIRKTEAIKYIIELILSHGGENMDVDVVHTNSDLWDYVYDKMNYIRCNDEFFKYFWDVYFENKDDHWYQTAKERLWRDILPDVEEKMEDEEFQEEWGVSFDSLDSEKSYFYTYWHYPMDSLGWDRDDLCEWYKDNLTNEDFYEMIKSYRGKSIKQLNVFGVPDKENTNMFYIIDNSLFF
jgi:hypothetical protein